jgi:hypothetical protein
LVIGAVDRVGVGDVGEGCVARFAQAGADDPAGDDGPIRAGGGLADIGRGVIEEIETDAEGSQGKQQEENEISGRLLGGRRLLGSAEGGERLARGRGPVRRRVAALDGDFVFLDEGDAAEGRGEGQAPDDHVPRIAAVRFGLAGGQVDGDGDDAAGQEGRLAVAGPEDFFPDVAALAGALFVMVNALQFRVELGRGDEAGTERDAALDRAADRDGDGGEFEHGIAEAFQADRFPDGLDQHEQDDEPENAEERIGHAGLEKKGKARVPEKEGGDAPEEDHADPGADERSLFGAADLGRQRRVVVIQCRISPRRDLFPGPPHAAKMANGIWKARKRGTILVVEFVNPSASYSLELAALRLPDNLFLVRSDFKGKGRLEAMRMKLPSYPHSSELDDKRLRCQINLHSRRSIA